MSFQELPFPHSLHETQVVDDTPPCPHFRGKHRTWTTQVTVIGWKMSHDQPVRINPRCCQDNRMENDLSVYIVELAERNQS